MIKEYIVNEVLDGFNPDIIISNKPGAIKRGLNLDLEKESGTIRVRKGSARYGDQIEDNYSVLGLFDFTKSNGTIVPLAVSDGATNTKQVYLTAGSWTDAKTGLTVAKKMRFQNLVGYCFMTNGEEIYTSADGITWSTTNLLNTVTITSVAYADPLVTLTVPGGHEVAVGDSITVADLAPAGYNGVKTVTAVTATTIVYSEASLGALTDTAGSLTVQFPLAANDILEHGNYLFLIGLKGFRSDIMWSQLPSKSGSSYVLSWKRTNNVTIETGNGEDLVGGINYRNALYLFKPSSITKTIAPVNVNGLKELSKNVGAKSKDCILVVGGQLLFYCQGNRNAKRGIYSYNSLADAEPQIISEPMQPYIDGMSATADPVFGSINELLIIYVGAVTNKQYGISITNCYLVFDTKTDRWLGAWSFPFAAKVMAQMVQSNVAYLHVGDADGKVWQLNTGYRDTVEANAGVPIAWEAVSHPLDIGRTPLGYKNNYTKRKVLNVWVLGEDLAGVKFACRYDKQAALPSWNEEVGAMTSPVTQFSLTPKEAYLFQYKFSGIKKAVDSPSIRKLRIQDEQQS